MTSGKPWDLWVIGGQWQQQSFQPSPCHCENRCALNSEGRYISGPIYVDGCSTQTPQKPWFRGRMALVALLTLTEVSHQGRFSGACFF